MDKVAPKIAEAIVRRLLGYGAVALAGHGVVLSDSTTAMILQVGIAAIMSGADVAWSIYEKYGRRWVTAKLEIMAATAEAQAEILHKARLPAPTATEIADRIPDPNVTAKVVTEALSKPQP